VRDDRRVDARADRQRRDVTGPPRPVTIAARGETPRDGTASTTTANASVDATRSRGLNIAPPPPHRPRSFNVLGGRSKPLIDTSSVEQRRRRPRTANGGRAAAALRSVSYDATVGDPLDLGDGVDAEGFQPSRPMHV
jgi:hypothetical protein